MQPSALFPYLQRQKQLAHYYRDESAAFPAFISFGQVAEEGPDPLAVRLHTDRRAVPLHGHGFFELMAVFAGSVVHTAAGSRYPLRAGEFLLLPPGADHEVEACGADTLAVNLLFSPSFFRQSPAAPAAFLRQRGPFYFPTSPDTDAWRCLTLLLCEYFDPRPATGAVAAALLGALLQLLAARLPEDAAGPRRAGLDTAAVLRYLDEHYAHAQLKDVAARFGYVPDHLSAALKAATGHSFMALKQQRCMRAAALLLATTQDTVQSIAAQTGFTNTTYFHRLFRQTFGCTPSAYRRLRT